MQILEKIFSDTVRENSSAEINYTLTTTNAGMNDFKLSNYHRRFVTQMENTRVS